MSLEVGDVGARHDSFGDIAAGMVHDSGLELHTEHVATHRDSDEYQIVRGGGDVRLGAQGQFVVVSQGLVAWC